MTRDQKEDVGTSTNSVKPYFSQKRLKYIGKLRSMREKNKEQLLNHIINSKSDGLSASELKKLTGFHRDTVYTLCEQLKNEGTIVKIGHLGKYRLTPKAISNPRIGGFLFGREATKQVLRGFTGISGIRSSVQDTRNFEPKEWISATSEFCNKRFGRKVLSSKPEKEDQALREMLIDKDGLTLFEFSLRIGALMTFIFMKGMRYQSSADAMAWIRNAVMLQSLLGAFEKIEPVAGRLEGPTKKGKPQPQESQEYGMRPDHLQSLEEVYGSVFPKLYQKLETILAYTPYLEEQRSDQLKSTALAGEVYNGSKDNHQK